MFIQALISFFISYLPQAEFYQTFWYICITNFESNQNQIKLEIHMRKNQYDYKKTSKHFQKEKKANRNIILTTL